MFEPIAMSKVRAGQKVHVVHLQAAEETVLRKLTAFGIMPGVEIEVLQTYPTYVLRVGYTEIAVDCEIANHIMVKHINMT
jgi:ferrous iron transport protein A